MKTILRSKRNQELILAVLNDSGRLKALHSTLRESLGHNHLDIIDVHTNFARESNLNIFFDQSEVAEIAQVRVGINLNEISGHSFSFISVTNTLIAQILTGSSTGNPNEIGIKHGHLAKEFVRHGAELDEAIQLERAVFDEALDRFYEQVRKQQLASAS